MRRALRRSLVVLGTALLAAGNAPQQAAAQVAPAPAVEKSVRLAAASKKLTPRERAAEAAKKKDEAQARLSHVWILGRDVSRPALLFARMNGDDVRILLSCQSEAGLVRVIVYDVPAKGMRTGDGARVRLSNGPARLEVAATALPNEKNPRAVDLGGTTKVSPRLFSLLETGDTMVVEVPGRTTGLSLKTLGPKAEAFKRACLAQR
jgi:hypothetical protein